MVSTRNLPGARRPEFTFGSTDCHYGYEGNVDEMRYAVLQSVLLLLLLLLLLLRCSIALWVHSCFACVVNRIELALLLLCCCCDAVMWCVQDCR
jgi:hypothetical protein